MLVVTSDNVSLFALKLGEGRPIVMIHGLLFGNLTTWWYTVAPELARQHRVILYDLRGHGRSERVPSGYDAVTMASDLISVIEEVAREPAVVVGHSFGGAIALEAALDRPELVAKVVVVEAPLPPALPDLASFVPESKEAVMAMIPERLHGTAAAMARSPRRERRFAESLSFLMEQSSLQDDLANASDIDDSRLGRLRVPLLAIYGSRSSCRPVGDRLARTTPNGRVIEIEGGHFLQFDATLTLARAIAEFADA